MNDAPGSSARYINEHELATQLGIRVATLRKWRLFGRGPQFVRFGRAVRYPTDRLVGWLASRSGGGEPASLESRPSGGGVAA